ncbi:MAG: hypothetical protein PVG22_02580 [Chromatiales bacterium]|jgi:hypothetical protein
MKTLKVLLVTLVMLLFSGIAYAECGDPGPNPDPGTRPPWAGSCTDDVMEVLGTGDHENGRNGDLGGKCGEGSQHQYGLQDEAELLGEGICGGQCGEGEQHQYGRQ